MLRRLYKPDTSLGRTAEAGPDGVRLKESWLYLRYFVSLRVGDRGGGGKKNNTTER